MPEIFDNANACDVLKMSKWFSKEELKPLSNESSINSLFENSFTGCEVDVLNNDFHNKENCSQMLKYAPKINGEVEDFRQSLTVGDCWLVASAKSLSVTPNGKNAIKQSIYQDECGNVTVTLKGGKPNINKIYISAEEISKTKNLSQGDDDVKVLEMAIRKYRKLKLVDDIKSENQELSKIKARLSASPNSGSPTEALYLITGKPAYESNPFYTFNSGERKINDIDVIKNAFKNVLTNPSVLSISNKTVKGDDVSFNVGDKKLFQNHAYSIVGIKDDILQLRNPHNTVDIIEVSIKDFAEVLRNDTNKNVKLAEIKYIKD